MAPMSLGSRQPQQLGQLHLRRPSSASATCGPPASSSARSSSRHPRRAATWVAVMPPLPVCLQEGGGTHEPWPRQAGSMQRRACVQPPGASLRAAEAALLPLQAARAGDGPLWACLPMRPGPAGGHRQRSSCGRAAGGTWPGRMLSGLQHAAGAGPAPHGRPLQPPSGGSSHQCTRLQPAPGQRHLEVSRQEPPAAIDLHWQAGHAAAGVGAGWDPKPDRPRSRCKWSSGWVDSRAVTEGARSPSRAARAR